MTLKFILENLRTSPVDNLEFPFITTGFAIHKPSGVMVKFILRHKKSEINKKEFRALNKKVEKGFIRKFEKIVTRIMRMRMTK